MISYLGYKCSIAMQVGDIYNKTQMVFVIKFNVKFLPNFPHETVQFLSSPNPKRGE